MKRKVRQPIGAVVRPWPWGVGHPLNHYSGPVDRVRLLFRWRRELLRCLLLSLAFGVVALAVAELALVFAAFASAALPILSLSMVDRACWGSSLTPNALPPRLGVSGDREEY